MSNFNILVQGGTVEDNSHLCMAIQSCLSRNGFSQVQVDPFSWVPVPDEGDLLQAMSRLNPDLFDTPITVSGETEQEVHAMDPAFVVGLPPMPYPA